MPTGPGSSGVIIKLLFAKEPSPGVRLLLAAVVAGALMLADIRLEAMGNVRAVLSTVVYPLYWVADLPTRLSHWSQQNLHTHHTLQGQNQALRAALLLAEGRLGQMESLRVENARLRGLLNSSELLRDDVLVAELVGVSPDPARHIAVLNKGSGDGVFLGQPLIDAHGLMGQVVEVAAGHCRVLLLTDTTHATPVQVNRNGVRSIAEGAGRLDALELRHVASTEDIQEGDLLVSSGLGGRFPVGYPVATVTEVVRDPGQPFARVLARPSAELNRSRYMLLVFPEGGMDGGAR